MKKFNFFAKVFLMFAFAFNCFQCLRAEIKELNAFWVPVNDLIVTSFKSILYVENHICGLSVDGNLYLTESTNKNWKLITRNCYRLISLYVYKEVVAFSDTRTWLEIFVMGDDGYIYTTKFIKNSSNIIWKCLDGITFTGDETIFAVNGFVCVLTMDGTLYLYNALNSSWNVIARGCCGLLSFFVNKIEAGQLFKRAHSKIEVEVNVLNGDGQVYATKLTS
jgi:hypothetical protein